MKIRINVLSFVWLLLSTATVLQARRVARNLHELDPKERKKLLRTRHSRAFMPTGGNSDEDPGILEGVNSRIQAEMKAMEKETREDVEDQIGLLMQMIEVNEPSKPSD